MERQNKVIASTLSRITHKLFVMSGKGGVGKSSVSTNLAAALAIKGFKVGLLDVDIHGPSIPHLLGLTGLLEIDQHSGIQPKRYNENLLVVSMESLLKDPDQAVLWKGPMKASVIRQFISDVSWGDLDFLVIDSPPGTGDEPMAVLQTMPDAASIVVTTPQEISLADVRKSINFLQYIKANILGVVENMSGLVCPHCAQEIEIFKRAEARNWQKNMDCTFLARSRWIRQLWWPVTWVRRLSCWILHLQPKTLSYAWPMQLLQHVLTNKGKGAGDSSFHF